MRKRKNLKRRFLWTVMVGAVGVIASSGCVSPYQVSMERAMYSQEYRNLEDQYYALDQEADALANENQMLRKKLGESSATPHRAKSRPQPMDDDLPQVIPPISTEGLHSSEQAPDSITRPDQGAFLPKGKKYPPQNQNRIIPSSKYASPYGESMTVVPARPPKPMGPATGQSNDDLSDWSPTR